MLIAPYIITLYMFIMIKFLVIIFAKTQIMSNFSFMCYLILNSTTFVIACLDNVMNLCI